MSISSFLRKGIVTLTAAVSLTSAPRSSAQSAPLDPAGTLATTALILSAAQSLQLSTKSAEITIPTSRWVVDNLNKRDSKNGSKNLDAALTKLINEYVKLKATALHKQNRKIPLAQHQAEVRTDFNNRLAIASRLNRPLAQELQMVDPVAQKLLNVLSSSDTYLVQAFKGKLVTSERNRISNNGVAAANYLSSVGFRILPSIYRGYRPLSYTGYSSVDYLGQKNSWAFLLPVAAPASQPELSA